MLSWLIVKLYNNLDNWSKWEVYHEIKCPSIDSVFAEQLKQANKIWR